MGQEEVYQFLKKNKNKWFYIKEISEAVGGNQSTVSRVVRTLRKRNEVEVLNDISYNNKNRYIVRWKH